MKPTLFTPFLGAASVARAVALSVACLAPVAYAAGAPDAAPLRYFDGGVARTIAVDAAWVADIHQPAALVTSERVQAKTPTIASASLVTLRSASQPVARGASGAISPVFREGDSPAGRLMALPGGVLVKVPAAWVASDVSRWATAQGLAMPQRLGTGGNWYLIATAPGLASLELANALQQGGDVVFATPNWWKQTTNR